VSIVLYTVSPGCYSLHHVTPLSSRLLPVTPPVSYLFHEDFSLNAPRPEFRPCALFAAAGSLDRPGQCWRAWSLLFQPGG